MTRTITHKNGEAVQTCDRCGATPTNYLKLCRECTGVLKNLPSAAPHKNGEAVGNQFEFLTRRIPRHRFVEYEPSDLAWLVPLGAAPRIVPVTVGLHPKSIEAIEQFVELSKCAEEAKKSAERFGTLIGEVAE